jgi:hypothetical protein
MSWLASTYLDVVRMVNEQGLQVGYSLKGPLFLSKKQCKVEERSPEVWLHGHSLLEPVLSLPGVTLTQATFRIFSHLNSNKENVLISTRH